MEGTGHRQRKQSVGYKQVRDKYVFGYSANISTDGKANEIEVF